MKKLTILFIIALFTPFAASAQERQPLSRTGKELIKKLDAQALEARKRITLAKKREKEIQKAVQQQQSLQMEQAQRAEALRQQRQAECKLILAADERLKAAEAEASKAQVRVNEAAQELTRVTGRRPSQEAVLGRPHYRAVPSPEQLQLLKKCKRLVTGEASGQ